MQLVSKWMSWDSNLGKSGSRIDVRNYDLCFLYAVPSMPLLSFSLDATFSMQGSWIPQSELLVMIRIYIATYSLLSTFKSILSFTQSL